MNTKQHEANQRLFNESWAHIIKQGRPSINGSSCAYRSSEGLQCAFGPAIKEYSPLMEGDDAKTLLKECGKNLHDWARDASPDLSQEIQRAHDSNSALVGETFIHLFKEEMRKVAEEYSLQVPQES